MKKRKGRIIGIDLGTSNTRVAMLVDGVPLIIQNFDGLPASPSVVAFRENGKRLIGHMAEGQYDDNPRQIVRGIKRFIGRRYCAATVQLDMDRLLYNFSERTDGLININIGEKSYYPAEISAFILQEMKRIVENYLGEKIREAVITVPTDFDDTQRQATLHAAKIAELNVRRIINDTTAAALAFSQGKKRKKKIAVFDLGGGKFAFSIVEIGGGIVEVISSCGDCRLGGDDFDFKIVDYIASEFKKKTGADIYQEIPSPEQLKNAAENAKIELSSSEQTDIRLLFDKPDSNGSLNFDLTLSRSKYEELAGDLTDRCVSLIKASMLDAGVLANEINEIFLVGGMAYTPKIIQIVDDIFGRKSKKCPNPDEMVVYGAAIQAGILAGDVQDTIVLEAIPYTVGVEIQGGKMNRLIDRNSAIPVKKSRVYSTGSDNQEVISIHVLQGESKLAKENKTLGRFELTGIQPKPKGIPKIEVTIEIDSNCIATVSARDLDTGRKQKIESHFPTDLSKSEISRMAMEARIHSMAEKDSSSGA